MSTLAVPSASLERLRAVYANFEQMAQIIIEAMGVGPGLRWRLDLQAGVFVIDEPEPQVVNGHVNDTLGA
jgi:hypothetical protein